MAAELPVISFLCVAFLAALIPLQWRRINIAHFAITCWLFVCNLIHGVNAILWYGNVDIRAPVWCDITTKILLSTNIAIPAACVCLCGHLELVSSARKLRIDTNARRVNTFIEVSLCLGLPLLYVALHPVFQHRRFFIVADFGCEAAIYPSVASICFIWLPPLLLCSSMHILREFFCSGVALYRAGDYSSSFSEHLKSRSRLTMASFLRRAMTCIMTILILSALFVFSIASVASVLQPWTSFANVHERILDIQVMGVVVPSYGRTRVEWTWWTVPVLSAVFIAYFCASEEAMDGYRVVKSWFGSRIRKRPQLKPLVLPIHNDNKPPSETTQTDGSKTFDLRSGWDDTLDFKKSKPKPKARTGMIYSPPPTSIAEDDASFTASTLSYLESPIAQTLGLPAAPAPAHASDSKKPDRLSVHTAGVEDARSVLRDSWPEAPTLSPSRPDSPSSIDTFGYPLYPAITPPHLRSTPFQGHTIPEVPSLPEVKHGKRMSPARRFLRSPSRDSQHASVYSQNSEVIYMTVVKEVEAV